MDSGSGAETTIPQIVALPDVSVFRILNLSVYSSCQNIGNRHCFLGGGGGGGGGKMVSLLFSKNPPGPLFILGFERAWSAKIRHLTSLLTSVGVSMETPSFTMTSFRNAYGQVVAWCKYSSSENDGRIAS